MLAQPPLSLYIHIPWCVKKCPYCDFNSHEFGARASLPEDTYIAALCEDFDADYALACGGDTVKSPRPIHSIFIGGGTPSLFSARAFDSLLQHIARSQSPGWIGSPHLEITLEANPGTLEAGRFAEFRAAGINRLSIGVQSFADAQLSKLGRIHDSAQARRAIDSARAAGFDNFNLDIMHGLPDQSLNAALSDLDAALSFEPPHLSWYQLTIEPNTVFYSKPPPLPSESILTRVQDAGHDLLVSRGLAQYEVSAYARGDRLQSRHNLNYWQFGDYLGIGAGAHGKISLLDGSQPLRTRKHRQPDHYLRAASERGDAGNLARFTAESTPIPIDEITIEYLLNTLRTRRGFSPAHFETHTGVAFSEIANRVEYLRSRDLLCASSFGEGWITTTARGFRYLNNVLEEFI
jgi:oxygen-independent coproporphyrinogen-3 oxidase